MVAESPRLTYLKKIIISKKQCHASTNCVCQIVIPMSEAGGGTTCHSWSSGTLAPAPAQHLSALIGQDLRLELPR